MRLVVGAQIQPKDRPVLEALADDLDENLTDVDDETLDRQFQLLAWLLREDRLELKIGLPSDARRRGIFPG